WSERARRTAATLLEKDRRKAVLLLAEQCKRLGDAQLAEEILNLAVRFKDGEKKQPLVLLAGVELALRWNRHDRAEKLVEELLKLEGWSSWSSLWRVAWSLAAHREANK